MATIFISDFNLSVIGIKHCAGIYQRYEGHLLFNQSKYKIFLSAAFLQKCNNFGRVILRLFILGTLLLGITLPGCKPKSTCVSSGGGKGGGASISVSPSHAGAYVDSFKVYIKYGTLSTPANSIYDDSAWCVMVDTIPVAKFTNLKAGLYFFYGTGYHAAYNAIVVGQVNYTMCDEHAASILMPTF